MQVTKRKLKVRGGSQVDSRKYPHRIQLYALPPTEEITLEEFENFGYDRLKGTLPRQWSLCADRA